MSDEAFLLFLLFLPAVATALLPRVVRLIAAIGGVVGAYLMLFVLPAGGADSPAPFFAAALAAGAVVGAILGEVLALVRRRVRLELKSRDGYVSKELKF